MRAEAICAGILFTVMIFSPCVLLENEESSSYENIQEVSSYAEPSISVLNIYDGSVFSVPMEEYILGVVLAEMPASFEKEALKAQSVAARTYAVGKLASPSHENAHICMAASCCQAYIYPSLYEGGENNLLKVKDAVDKTRGKIMTFSGEPVLAVFHSMSAGKTEDAENVWGKSVPYLKSVDSSSESNLENFETNITFSFEEFSEKIKRANPSATVSSATDIKVAEYTPAGYVKSIEIGSHKFTGSEIRSIFSLRSSAFTIEKDNESISFTVKGYGHGVGMSQHGANVLAKEGKSYEEILTHYYNGIELEIIK